MILGFKKVFLPYRQMLDCQSGKKVFEEIKSGSVYNNIQQPLALKNLVIHPALLTLV